MDELRLVLLAVGGVIIVLIYLWGMRARIRSSLERRRRTMGEEPVLGEEADFDVRPDLGTTVEEPGDFPGVADDPLAGQRLVDVEIRRLDGNAGKERTSVLSASTRSEHRQSNEAVEASQTQSAPTIDRHTVPEPALEPESESEPEPSLQEEAATGSSRADKSYHMTLVLTVMAPSKAGFTGIEILEAAQEVELKLSKSGVLDYVVEQDGKRIPVLSIAHLREPGIFSLDSVRTLVTPGLLIFMQLPGPQEAVSAVDLMMRIASQLAEKLGGTVCDEQRKEMTPQSLLRMRSRADEFSQRQGQPPAL